MPVKKSEDKNELSIKIQPQTAEALCYLPYIGLVASLAFIVMEKHPGVRWNALQALLLNIVIFAITGFLTMTIIFSGLVTLVLVGGLLASLWLMVKIYQGDEVRLPYLAEIADKLVKQN